MSQSIYSVIQIQIINPSIFYSNLGTTYKKEVDLLVTSNSGTNHYVWIKNFDRLCSNVTKDKAKKFFCKRCYNISLVNLIYKNTKKIACC